MTPDVARERVYKGAELLDKLVHNWRSKIDLGNLKMSKPSSCILGQLAGDITGSPDARYYDAERYLVNALGATADEYGFDLPPSGDMSLFDNDREEGWELLYQAWLDETE
jgi:hypothetical protein